MTKVYAGIGSRRTPRDIQTLMTRIAEKLSSQGWTLRSGHADGADLAFERGAGTNCEVYLPWASFNQHWQIEGHRHAAPTQAAMLLAQAYHPAWQKCSSGAKQLHARNMHQILGPDLQEPVKFVLCWTPDGQDSGGTGQALRLARKNKIPVFNLHDPETHARLSRFCG